MSVGKAIGAVVGGFFIQTGGLYLIHKVWMRQDYIDTAGLWRDDPDMNRRMWATLLGTVLYLIGLVIIYSRGVEKKPWVLQGIRFGILITIINIVYTSLASWTVIPIPHMMIVKWILGEGSLCVILSIFIAGLMQPSVAATEARSV
jgi:hypothetical protein